MATRLFCSLVELHGFRCDRQQMVSFSAGLAELADKTNANNK